MRNANLYAQMYDQIKTQLGLEYLQLLGTPQSFYWPTPVTGQMDPTAYQVVSAEPLWSPVGNYATDASSFVDAYKQVLQHITYELSPEQQQQMSEAKNRITQAQNAVTQAYSDANASYLAAKQNGGAFFTAQYPTINDWITKAPEAKVYNDNIAKLSKNVAQQQDFYDQLVHASMPMTLQAALDGLEKPTADPATAPSPAGWTKVPDGSGILRWQPSFRIGTNGGDWRAQLSQGSQGSFEISLAAAESTSDFDKSWAGGDAGYDAFFWGVAGGGGWERMNLTEDDDSVTVNIGVKSSTLVNVTPGSWYDGGLLSEIARAQQGSGGQGWKITEPWVPCSEEGRNSLFGPNGILKTGVAQLLVVYQPSFRITMGHDTYERHHEKFQAGGGIRIGPFHFGGHGGHESDYRHSTNQENTFEGQSTSTFPQIIGVVVDFPGLGQPGCN